MAFSLNEVFLSVFASWFISQAVLKTLVRSIKIRRFCLHAFFSAGGMPSSHTALVCAISTAIGLNQGFLSPLFAVCLAFSGIVVHDVMLRKKMIQGFLSLVSEQKTERKVLENLEHSFLEVLVGAAVGIGTVLAFFFF